MRKSFTRLFGFLLLNVMMLLSVGAFAQTQQQSTIELAAPTLTQCYNFSNSYSADVQVKDFIAMKSFDLTLNYDKTVFGVTNVTPVAAIGGTFTWAANQTNGTVNVKWTVGTGGNAVTYSNGTLSKLFTVKFTVLSPSSAVTNYTSALTWASNSFFYYSDNWAAGTTYQTNTTAYTAGSISVPVNVSADAIQVSSAGVTCSGSSAIITVTSPVGAGYTYYFNGSTTGSATPTATATAPSTNQVVVVDAAGCASMPKSFTVNAPAALAYGVATSTAACYQGNGAITFSPTGSTGPYTYWVVPVSDWNFVQSLILAYSPGGWNVPALAPYQYTTAQVLKPAGQYYVNVNSATNCNPMGYPTANPSWQLVTITAPSAISVSATKVDQTCTTKGSITVTQVLGGTASPTGSYLVSIDNLTWKQVTSTTPTATFSGLSGGTYTVTAVDSKGCIGTSVITVGAPTPMVFSVGYTDASCFNGTTGTASVSVTSGGVGSMYYALPLQSSGYTVATIGTATTVTWTPVGTTTTGLAANYYSVFVKDGAGCIQAYNNQTLSGNIVPIQNPAEIKFTPVVSTVSCDGTATVTVTATGGHTPYTYVFDNGTASTTTSNTFVYTGLVAGSTQSVTVKVIDNNGTCSATQSVSIVVPQTLAAHLSPTDLVIDPICHGNNDGRATVMVDGGAAPFKYSINGVNFNDVTKNTVVVAIPEGTTTITIKDSAGCLATTTAVAGTLTPSTITAAAVGKIACHGGSTGIQVTQTWPGGSTSTRTVTYYYASTESAVYSSGAAFNPAFINSNANTATPTTFIAGTYYIGAKDQLGCVAAVVSVTVSENTSLTAAVATTDATCFGQYNGSISIVTSGGSSTPTYAIANTPEAAANMPDGNFQNLDTYSATTTVGTKTVVAAKGTYYVVVKDNCGRFVAPVKYVGGLDAVTFNGTVGTTSPTCSGKSDGVITAPLAKGGNGSYVYSLTKPDGSTVTSTSVSFSGLVAGTYTLSVTDTSGCTSSASISVTLNQPDPLVLTSALVTNISCKGANNGVIVINAQGGVKPYALAVNSTLDGAFLAFGSATTSKPYVATQPGVYNLYLKDANGCIGNVVSVTVSEPLALTASVTVTKPTCASGGTATATITAVGGWAGTVTSTYIYGVGTATSTNNVFGGKTPGDYVATVTDNTGVYSTTVTTASATITYTYPQISCAATTPFTITQLMPYLYTGTATAVKCKDGSDGTFLVTVLQGTAATTTTATGDEYLVQLTSTLTPTLTVTDWKMTKNQKYLFTGLPLGHYTVWIASAPVAGLATPTSSTDIYHQGACVLPIGSEPMNPNQTGPYMYAESWTIQQPAVALTASATWTSDVACNNTGGSFVVNAAGGTASYTYSAKLSVLPAHVFAPDPASSEWQDSNAFTGKAAGTWIVWTKDANGCIVGGETDTTTGLPVDKYRVEIKQPQPLKFTATVADATCNGANDGKINITPSDATRAPFTYTITGFDYNGTAVSITGTTTSVVQPVYTVSGIPANVTAGSSATNVYTVSIADKNGCTSTSTTVAQIKQSTVLSVNLVKAAGMFLCPGDISGVIEAQVTGGSTATAYQYQLYKNGVQYSPATGWGTIPSYIVEAGYTYNVIVKDANGCTASSTNVLNAPKPVKAEMQETTCFSDVTASVIIKATGEAGRTFQYRSRLNTDPAFADATTGWAAVTSQPVSGFIFANVNPTQNFYYFEIKDSEGCTTSKTYSFVPTQIKLTATVAGIGGSATVTVAGGISPYAYAVGSAAKADWTGSVSGGSYPVIGLVDGANTINVFDAHGCVVSPALTYTADLTAPTATYTPNGTATPTEDNYPTLVVKFSEDVAIGAGNVKINKVSDGSTVVTIPASAITVSGSTATLVYAGGLDKDTQYYVTIDAGVVKDLANNNFAGVTSSSTWTFKTGNQFKVDVPDPVNTLEFKVYPNPFVDYVTIANASELSKVVVSNIAGQVVKEVAYPTATLQLSELRSGVYFVTLYQDEKVVNTVKLLKR